MAILLTYPEDKFDDEMLLELYNWNPVFLPLKRIEYLPWTKQKYQIIDDSLAIVVTSMLAIQALVKSDVSLDKLIYVVSSNAARLLRQFHFKNVFVLPVENQQQLISDLNDILAEDDQIVFLKSNLAKDLKARPQVQNIDVYENVWTEDDEKKAIAKIGAADFTKVLITSPIEFYRFESIEEKIPQQFMTAKYYTLDHQTKGIMDDLGFENYMPKHKRNILKQAVWKIAREK